ncbi:RNA polymerase sigma-70 factor [Sphingobacterium arenae]|uniref:RNA polymerase sigma-70 factor n=1 Tax=Sphingobacterium arenae TaxID=1280598 RepID=A0ABR7Y460_9SPHI|nr:RNA polymerase sigma-70 factor [Sphingobacterium arenae]MBD1426046.1 RNA polymerase sigma-70 factor [Sphingobacterium arenae]
MQIDKKQFEVLFHLYWKRMFSFAVKAVMEEEDAEEIVQDVFKSLWERRKELELQDAERYLLRAVKLRTLEHLRNRGNRLKHHQVILQNKTPYYEEDNFHYKELYNQLNTVVDSLPNQCKNVFKMSREEGLTNKEIANNLLITERAVEYHISKALSVIKLKLSKSLNLMKTN